MPFPIQLTIPVQWGDMDALGHVNNTCYFRWFESARIALWGRAGLPLANAGATGPILATTTCDYLEPLAYPGDITVGAAVSKVGTTSITMVYGLWRVDTPGRLVARGSSVVVLVEYQSGRKIPIDAAQRALLDTLVQSGP